MEYPCEEKAPPRRGAFPKALGFDFGFAGCAMQPVSILMMSGSLAQRSLGISNAGNCEFDLSYAASLHCAVTSFAALLR